MTMPSWTQSLGAPSLGGIIPQFAGVAACYWNDPAGIALLATQLGATQTPLYIWDGAADPVNIAAMIAGSEMYVWTDGTQTLLPQAVGDITGTLGVRYEGTQQKVHSFFYSCAKQLLAWLLQWHPSLNTLTRITLAGHSYGAAACGVLQDLLMAAGTVRPELCLFASPRWFIEPYLLNRNYGLILNLHGAKDLIAYVPSDATTAFLMNVPIINSYTGATHGWRDYTSHWRYDNPTPGMAGQSATLLMWAESPTVWGAQHTSRYHITEIASWYQRVYGAPSGNALLMYMLGLLSRTAPTTPQPKLNNLTGPQIDELQAIYFPRPQDPAISAGNFRQISNNGIEASVPQNGTGSIIPVASAISSGGGIMSLPGYKCTAFFEVGPYGWSHTLYTQNTSLAGVQTLFKGFYDALMPCMGTEPNAAGETGAGLGTVKLMYARYQPLSGLGAPTLVGPLDRTAGRPITSHEYASNMPSVCLFNSLTVSDTIAGVVVKGTRQWFLHGTPDLIIEGLRYQPANSAVYDASIQAFWAYLALPGSPWTMLVTDPTAANGFLQGGSLVSGRWVLQYTTSVPGANPLANGDRIRISRANPSAFNGSWVVANVDTSVTPNLITLATGPQLGGGTLKSGTWNKSYDKATRTPMKRHVSFNTNAQWTIPAASTAAYQVKSHKVGAPFRPIRGSKKKKRQTI